MNLQIRPAQLSDIDSILDFMVDYYEIEGYEFNRKQSKAALENFISSHDYGVLHLVQTSGTIIGYYCLVFSYTLASYGRDCFLDELFIKSEYRNRGYGSQVMKHIEKYLIDEGFKGIHLVVYDKNPAAYHYYLKNGFSTHKASFLTKPLV